MNSDRVREVLTAAEAHRKARVEEAEAFLRAKAARKDVTDGTAQRMATVETNDEVTLTEALLALAITRLTDVGGDEEYCECH